MKITVSPPKKYKKSHIVLNIFLQIFLTSDLMEDLWIIIIISVFILIQSVAYSLVEVIEEKSNEIISEGEEIVFETPIQKSEPVYSPQPQPQYQQQPQYYEPKNTQRVRNSSQNVVNRETKQYYNVSNEVSRDKFTSTMETSLRRSIKRGSGTDGWRYECSSWRGIPRS